MATLDLTMVLKLNDKATRQMRRFNKTLDQTKKKLQEIGRLRAKTTGAGRRAAGPTGIGAGAGDGGIGGAGTAAAVTVVVKALAGMQILLNTIFRSAAQFREVLEALVTSLTKMVSKTSEFGKALKKLTGRFEIINQKYLENDRKIRQNTKLLNKNTVATKANARATGRMGAQWQALKLRFAAIAVVLVLGLRSIIKTGIELEKMRATLSAVIPATDNVGEAFAFLVATSKKLPATLQEVTTAFIRMQALGLKPTEEKLLSFGNTAAASGKSVLQFVEAVADAVVGENERLKEFGIKAKVNGDKVAFTFRGLTDVVENNARSISEFLVSIGSDAESGFKAAGAFAGAATKQMNTLDGTISNLGVSYDLLADIITDTLNPVLKFLLNNLSSIVEEISETIVGIRRLANFISGALAKGLINLDFLIRKLGTQGEERERLNRLNKLATEGIDKQTAATDAELASLIDVEAAAKKYSKTLDERAKGEINTTIHVEKLAHETQEYGDFINELVNSLRDQTAATENAWRAQDDLDQQFQDGLITSTEYIAGLEKLNEILGVELPESLDELNAFWQQAFSNMQSDLGEFFGQAAIRKFDNFRDAMQSLGADFARTIGRMVAQWLAAKVLTGGFGLFGIDVGGRGFADGGRPPVNLPSVVGERGPELFVPDTSGTIVPNEAMGGKTVQINVHSVDGTDTMRVLEKSKREITEMVFGTQATFNMGTA